MPGNPCVGNTEKIAFIGFLEPENQPKVWVQHDIIVTVSCTGIQPQNHPPIVNQLPTFETEVNKEIVITLSGYDPHVEENENLQQSSTLNPNMEIEPLAACCW